MRIYVVVAILSIELAISGCKRDEPDTFLTSGRTDRDLPPLNDPPEEMLSEKSGGNFILYVSNQSFAISPVDITIRLDGKKAVASYFDVGDQHWRKKYTFDLSQGEHYLTAVSTIGRATHLQKISIGAKNWAVFGYWYNPKEQGSQGTPHFEFENKNEPLFFQ